MWAQQASRLVLEGAAVRANRFAGVAAFEVSSFEFSDSSVEGTVEGVALVGSTGSIRAADGLHLVDLGEAEVRRGLLDGNDRVGFLADLAGASTDVLTLDDVTIRGAGDRLGAVAQNGVVQPGWDRGLTRLDSTAANDAAFEETLEIGAVVGPSCFPPIDGVRARGLGDLVP